MEQTIPMQLGAIAIALFSTKNAKVRCSQKSLSVRYRITWFTDLRVDAITHLQDRREKFLEQLVTYDLLGYNVVIRSTRTSLKVDVDLITPQLRLFK